MTPDPPFFIVLNAGSGKRDAETIEAIIRGALGQLGDADHVVSFAFDRLTVRPDRRRRIKVAMDGEVTWLRTPLVFQVAPHPLPLLVPACAMTTSPADADEDAL